MSLEISFENISLENLKEEFHAYKVEGWRFVQLLGVNTDNGVDLVYAFMKDNQLVNRKLVGVTKDMVVPSITDDFLQAFVFENETHDLFGVSISDIAIDFHGKFYEVAMSEPMTVISPAQKAAREKAAKLAAAQAAKAKKEAAQASSLDPAQALEAEIQAKTAGLDPEKAAKLRAAMERKAQKEAAQAAVSKQESIESKIAGLDPEKAARVKAAMEKKAQMEAAKAASAREKEIEDKIAGLDPEKAAKLRAALERKAQMEAAQAKEGE